MANKIASIRDSGIPRVDAAGFLAACKTGDFVFCQGKYLESRGIEAETGSCLSHVLTVWRDDWITDWLTLEATIDRGVHVGLLSDYVNKYDGDLVLCRREVLSEEQIWRGIDAGLQLLDDKYDVTEEIQMAAHKLLPFLRVDAGRKTLFCSAYEQRMSVGTGIPLVWTGAGDPTPEDNWRDPTVWPVCALVKS